MNTGPGIVYTCDSSVAASTCNYLNTTVAGYYNSVFTNANANIYIMYGTTSLGASEQYLNLVSYSDYVTALKANLNQDTIQTLAITALSDYDATPYSSGSVEVTSALGTSLGFPKMIGITTGGDACYIGSAACYNVLITVTNDSNTPLYYDDQGGAEPSDAYDFYAVVQHETDETLGTSSCIGTQTGSLVDDCDFAGGTGVPSAVDLFRYTSPGVLALDTAPSTSPGLYGQYFSYNGGVDYGVHGDASPDYPKVYNTLANGDDFADYTYSEPADCAYNEAIQDAEGCPGEDAGLTVLNDGESELVILVAVGYQVPGTTTPTPAVLTLPAPGSTLTGSSATFKWSAGTGVTEFVLGIGTTGVGSYNIFNSGYTTNLEATVTNLPTNGGTLYVRLFSMINGAWQHNDYTYTAYSAGQPAVLTSPTPGSELTGSSATFKWSAGTDVTEYVLGVGTTGVGSYNLFNSGYTTALQASVTNLPTTGGTVYVRIFSKIAGVWQYEDYTYAADSTYAVLTSPAVGSLLPGSSVTFQWSAGTGATEYVLGLGTTGAGSYNLFNSGYTTARQATATNLPTNGETIYARIFSLIGGVWQHNDYTYTANTPLAVLTTPTPGSTLTGSSVTFEWTAGTGVTEYVLGVGTTGVGSYNLLNSGYTTALQATATDLPTTGGTVYARLFSLINGAWQHIDYTYTAK